MFYYKLYIYILYTNYYIHALYTSVCIYIYIYLFGFREEIAKEPEVG